MKSQKTICKNIFFPLLKETRTFWIKEYIMLYKKEILIFYNKADPLNLICY